MTAEKHSTWGDELLQDTPLISFDFESDPEQPEQSDQPDYGDHPGQAEWPEWPQQPGKPEEAPPQDGHDLEPLAEVSDDGDEDKKQSQTKDQDQNPDQSQSQNQNKGGTGSEEDEDGETVERGSHGQAAPLGTYMEVLIQPLPLELRLQYHRPPPSNYVQGVLGAVRSSSGKVWVEVEYDDGRRDQVSGQGCVFLPDLSALLCLPITASTSGFMDAGSRWQLPVPVCAWSGSLPLYLRAVSIRPLVA